METFTVETDEALTTVNVTDRVRAAVPEAVDGVCTVFVRHTTAGVTIQEDESRLREDIETVLKDTVDDDGWRHDRIDDNADSHLRATLVGASESIPVEDGQLALGAWQSVLLVECDGPRTRTVTVGVV